jgi:periplasmic protein TonB
MFEGFTKGRAARKNRWKAPMIASGAVVHAVVFTGMWIHGVWEIKKVDAAEESSAITLQLEIPRVEEAGRPSQRPKDEPKKEAKKVVPDLQPEEKKPEDKPEAVPTTGNEESPTTGGGEDTEGLPTGTGTTGELPPMVASKPPPEAPKPPKPPASVNVVSKDLEARRTSGNAAIGPDNDTAQQIARLDSREVRGKVKLCLSSEGRVTSTQLMQSTTFSAYDEKLEREIRSWRYLPYTVNGVATPVCTMVTFVYRQR